MPKLPKPLTALRISYIIFGAVMILLILMFSHTDKDVNRANLSLISQYGWQVDETPADVVSITLPDEFDNVFNAYNSIIAKDGYDLSPYMGRRATRYSYRVRNHPQSGRSNIRINILICDGQVIAADISAAEAGGFVNSLNEGRP